MNNCQSCGMPMDKPEDHGGGRLDNPYCKYCTDIQGNLLPRETVRQNMIQFYTQKMGETPENAANKVEEIMRTMPAWQVGVPPTFTPPTPTEPPTPEVPSEPAGEPTTETPAQTTPPKETPTGEE